MYGIKPFHELHNPEPSTVMYGCKNYHADLDPIFGGDSKGDSGSAAKGNTPVGKQQVKQQVKQQTKTASPHHHKGAVSDFEQRQVAILSSLQQLSLRFDKLSGKSGSKKRHIAQAGEVKRQKTDSICSEEPDEPDTIVLSEPINLVAYNGKITPEIQTHFPLVIVLGYDEPLPSSLFVLASLLRERAAAAKIRMGIKLFMHSSCGEDQLSKWKRQQQYNSLANDGDEDISQCNAVINFICKKDARGPVLLRHDKIDHSRKSAVVGEFAIAKYLAKLADFYPVDGTSPLASFLTMDYWLYTADGFIKPSYTEVRGNLLEEMNQALGKRRFLIANNVSFADVILWSILNQSGVKIGRSSTMPLPTNTKRWFITLNSLKEFSAAKMLLS